MLLFALNNNMIILFYCNSEVRSNKSQELVGSQLNSVNTKKIGCLVLYEPKPESF